MIPEMQMLVALYPDAKSGDAGCFDSDVRGGMVRTRADAGEESD